MTSPAFNVMTAISAQQAEAIAALAQLYMSTETLTLCTISPATGSIAVQTDKWRWIIDARGKVAGEGPI